MRLSERRGHVGGVAQFEREPRRSPTRPRLTSARRGGRRGPRPSNPRPITSTRAARGRGNSSGWPDGEQAPRLMTATCAQRRSASPQVVRGEEDRHALARARASPRSSRSAAAATGSSPAVGSSRKSRRGPVQQRARDGQLLLHAPAPAADGLAPPIPEAQGLEQFANAGLARPRRRVARRARRSRDCPRRSGVRRAPDARAARRPARGSGGCRRRTS